MEPMEKSIGSNLRQEVICGSNLCPEKVSFILTLPRPEKDVFRLADPH